MKFKTLREAKAYLKKKGHYIDHGLIIFKRKSKRVTKYKYVVCTYLEWLNEFYK